MVQAMALNPTAKSNVLADDIQVLIPIKLLDRVIAAGLVLQHREGYLTTLQGQYGIATAERWAGVLAWSALATH